MVYCTSCNNDRITYAHVFIFCLFQVAFLPKEQHLLPAVLMDPYEMHSNAAANVLTNYHDRDIDAIMERTKDRPIPSGRITPTNARNFGLVLGVISLLAAGAISFETTTIQGAWAVVFIAFGLANNVLVYSYILKRKSRSNIILGCNLL